MEISIFDCNRCANCDICKYKDYADAVKENLEDDKENFESIPVFTIIATCSKFNTNTLIR